MTVRRFIVPLLAGLALGATATAARADTVTVAVTAIVEHPALDAVRDGLVARLGELGYVEGDTLEVVYESAQGSPAIAAQIARQFVGDAPDVIVPISTPSAQAVAAATSDIPVVFTAVTDPVAAGLVTDLEAPGGNVTGLSDMIPMADHLALIREILPDVARIGFLYNPGEANSVVLLDRMLELAGEAGVEVVAAGAPRSSDVLSATQSLVGDVDAVYIPTDNTVVSALEAVLSVGQDNDLPIFSGDTDSVGRGAIATIGFDYGDVGRQTADIVARVLQGEDPGTIPVGFAAGTDLAINPAAAAAMGVTLPDAVVERASIVVE
ncbi:MAG: ABC transporter substrate-binding protein [Rhodospirillaceae bacterium]|nr:ABC transporter substrate-binding protein [Rhodospirillaceae bacterium]